MALWIKNIGAAGDPLELRWFENPDDEFRRCVRFSDNFRPTGIAQGDRLLFHGYFPNQAVGHLCGVVSVADSAPEHDPRFPGDNWSWKRAINPLLILPLGAKGPTLEQVGLKANLMAQKSHVEIGATPFREAVRLMAEVALPK